MEKNQLDDFFNKKMSERSFEPEPEFWAGAEAMIEAQEKQGRRKKLLWWFFGSILFLIGLFILVRPVGQEQIADRTANVEEVETNNPAGPPTDDELSLKEQIEVNETNLNQHSILQKEKNNDHEIAYKKSLKDKSKPGKNITTKSKPEEQITTFEKIVTNIKSSTSPKSLGFDYSETKEVESEEINVKSQITIAKPSSMRSATLQILQLPTINNSLFSNIDYPVLDQPTPYNSPYPLPKHRRLNIGLQGGLAFFPAKGNEQFFTGFEVGGTAQFRISKKIQLGLGVLFVHNTGTFERSVGSEQVEYGFGKRVTNYAFISSSLNYLEVPVYFQYRKGRHRLEGGLSINYLLGVRGVLETTESQFPWERASLTKVTFGKTTWTSQDGFKKFHPAFHLGYRFHLTDRFDVGARIRFVAAKNEKIEEELPGESTELYKEFRPINFRVNLRYYLFR